MRPQASIFNYFPFLRFTLAFITGIIIRNNLDNVPSIFLTVTIIPLAASILLLVNAKNSFQTNRFFSLSVFSLLLCAGFIYTHLFLKGMFDREIPENATYSGIILEKLPATNNRFKYILQLDCVKRDDSLKLVNEKIVLYNSDSLSNTEIEPGKRVLFNTMLYEITNNNNPCEFDYKKFMKLKGIRYQAHIRGGIAFIESEHFNLKTSALNLRTKLTKMYRDEGIKGDEYSVLCALTLGDQNYISRDLKSSFSASGTTHVLSVSGLHVGIIFIIISFLLKPFDKNKHLKIPKILIILIFLWFYAFISGLSPPVLRSCSMFSFIVIGENFQRRTNTYNTLAVSAFFLMLINPLIIFDVGFQLSYLAVISIVFYQPKFSALIKPKNVIKKYLWGLLTVSIAAQLGTIPVCIFYFHQFPTYFLVSNIIVVPIAALILHVALPFYAFSFIPFLSKFLAILLKYMTWFLNHSVQSIELLPGSVIDGIWISDVIVFLLYTLLVLTTCFFIFKRGIYLNISLSILIIVLGIDLVKEIGCNRGKIIIIYNNTEQLISYIEGKKHYFYSPINEIGNYSMESLKNVSGNFRTSPPERLEKAGKKNCAIGKDYLYIDGCLIKLENRVSKNCYSNIQFDITYNLKESSIVLANNTRLKIMKLKGKKTTFDNHTNAQHSLNLKNDGALLLLLQ